MRNIIPKNIIAEQPIEAAVLGTFEVYDRDGLVPGKKHHVDLQSVQCFQMYEAVGRAWCSQTDLEPSDFPFSLQFVCRLWKGCVRLGERTRKARTRELFPDEKEES